MKSSGMMLIENMAEKGFSCDIDLLSIFMNICLSVLTIFTSIILIRLVWNKFKNFEIIVFFKLKSPMSYSSQVFLIFCELRENWHTRFNKLLESRETM
jgi:hypothetical protein